MGALNTSKIVVDGKLDTIETFYGDPRDRRVYVDGSVLSAEIVKVDNIATGTTQEVELLGELSGETYLVTVDENSTFYDKDKSASNIASDLSVGEVVYGTYELLSVVSINPGVPADYTYSVVPSSGVGSGYTLIESGVYISG